MNMAIDYLVEENQKLQQQIVRYQESVHNQILLQTPKRYLPNRFTTANPFELYSYKRYSMNDLNKADNAYENHHYNT